MNNIEALAAEFRQLKAELGTYGTNLSENAKAALAAVETRIAALTDKPEAKRAGKSAATD